MEKEPFFLVTVPNENLIMSPLVFVQGIATGPEL